MCFGLQNTCNVKSANPKCRQPPYLTQQRALAAHVGSRQQQERGGRAATASERGVVRHERGARGVERYKLNFEKALLLETRRSLHSRVKG
jgi:hypothetical protein